MRGGLKVATWVVHAGLGGMNTSLGAAGWLAPQTQARCTVRAIIIVFDMEGNEREGWNPQGQKDVS